MESFQLYDGRGELLAVQRVSDGSESLYYYTSDLRGSIVNVMDESANSVVSYTYTDFGETTEVQGAGSSEFKNVFRYTSGVYDEASGLYYLNARYYDPVSGRFFTLDSYRGEAENPRSLHRYGYCYSNPINHVDISGNIPVDTILDLASLGWSYMDMVKNPSWVNLGYLAWDMAAAIVPYAPGSYALKALNTNLKIYSRADDILQTGVWSMNKFARGYEIERALGGMANNFPTIDKYVVDSQDETTYFLSSVTCIKSIDLTRPSYQKLGRLKKTLQAYVADLDSFNGTMYKGNVYSINEGAERILEIAIPPVEMTEAQAKVFQEITDAAANSENKIKIVTRIVY